MAEPVLARAAISPSIPVVAGAFGTWRIAIEVGPAGIDDGGTIRVTQRGATDWQEAQFSDPSAEGYSRVEYQGEAALHPSFSYKGHIRPYFWCITIDVSGAALAAGEIVELVLGETAGGSPGMRAQTFQQKRHEFGIEIDPTNSNLPRRGDTLYLDVLPAEPQRLVVQVPSRAPLGETVTPFVKAEDRWGNPHLDVRIDGCRWEGTARFRDTAAGSGVFSEPGDGRFRVEGSCRGTHFSAYSNPLQARAAGSPLWWGDLHAQTGETVGAGDEDEYFHFAHTAARVDFASHQGNDFQISDGYWRHLQHKTAEYSNDGAFVVLPGYEWSGNSPVGGDHNVWFGRENAPIFRSSAWLLTGPSVFECAPTMSDLYAKLNAAGLRDEVLLGLHAGGRYADTRQGYDPDFSHVVEVMSCWGVFEWLLFDALQAGCVVGVVANSDGHKGRPGAEHPGAGEFGRRGGLTCVCGGDLTRASIFERLRARRCYATTGARIILEVALAGRTMGDFVELSEPAVLRVAAVGTAPIEKIEVFDDRGRVGVLRPPLTKPHPDRIRISWGGAKSRGRERRMSWAGRLWASGEMEIKKAVLVGAHSALDHVTLDSPKAVLFSSRTSGDIHAVDLTLSALDGSIEFACGAHREQFDVRTLVQPDRRALGGLDLFVCAERYPYHAASNQLAGEVVIAPNAGRVTPYFVKVTQTDLEMAWSSPIYIDAASRD